MRYCDLQIQRLFSATEDYVQEQVESINFSQLKLTDAEFFYEFRRTGELLTIGLIGDEVKTFCEAFRGISLQPSIIKDGNQVHIPVAPMDPEQTQTAILILNAYGHKPMGVID